MEYGRDRTIGEHVQVVELLIFAVLAAAVLYQLYAVLGRRVGRHAEDSVAPPPSRGPVITDGRGPGLIDAAAPPGLAAIQAQDPSFDVARFLQGARQAYVMIVRAFTTGDREALVKLVSPEVMTSFVRAMDARETEGRTETMEFLTDPRADIESLTADTGIARAKVRFLAEFRVRSKGPEGEAVDDRRTAEIWTFERPLASRDPNWRLARVDAAEA